MTAAQIDTPMSTGTAAVAVFAAFQDPLRRYFQRRITGPDAEDLLQDTLLRLHVRLPTLRNTERLAPFIHRIARSVLVDHLRRLGARPQDRPTGVSVEEALSELPGGGEDDDPSARPLIDCVRPFLQDLPAEQAEALALCDLGELSQPEAARRLGVPTATLKARVQRGRRRLRLAFERCCALEIDSRGRVIAATPHDGCGPSVETDDHPIDVRRPHLARQPAQVLPIDG